MKRFFLLFIPLTLVFCMFFTGCSVESSERSNELKDALSDTYDDLSATFSSDSGQYSLVSEYLKSWANQNDITIEKQTGNYTVLTNPATEGMKDVDTTVLQCGIKTNDFKNSMQPLSIALTSLLGPEEHGKISLIVTEIDDGKYTGASAVDTKYFKDDRIINVSQSDEILLYTKGASEMKSTMTSHFTTAAPAYNKAYAVTMSISGYHDLFDTEDKYPNPIETLGKLLASEKSSGVLFQLASFECNAEDEYVPTTATAIVVVDESSVSNFTSRFKKSYNSIKNTFEKLEDNFVYTMTETAMPSAVMSSQDSDDIISLMYTLKTGTYLQDEDSGDIISVSHLSDVTTKNNEFKLKMISRSLQKDNLNEISSTNDITSGLCDASCKSSDIKLTWTAGDDPKSAGAFLTDALGSESSIVSGSLESSEYMVLYSRGKTDVVSYTCNINHGEVAVTNITNFISSLTE